MPGHSRGNAPTTPLPTFVHASFDQHWKDRASARRLGRRTQVTVGAPYAQMLVAVDRILLLTHANRNIIAGSSTVNSSMAWASRPATFSHCPTPTCRRARDREGTSGPMSGTA